MNKSNFYKALGITADFVLVAGLVVAVVVGLTGCSINVVVAPGATFAVDSLNTSDDSNNVVVNNEDL